MTRPLPQRDNSRIIGYRDLATLVVAVERELALHRPPDADHTTTREAAILVTA